MDSHVAKFGGVSSPTVSAPAVSVSPRGVAGVEPAWPHKPCVAITSHADANVVAVGELDVRMVCKFPLMKFVNGIIVTGVADSKALEFWVEGTDGLATETVTLPKLFYCFSFGTGDWEKDVHNSIPFCFTDDTQYVSVLGADRSRSVGFLCQEIHSLFTQGKAAELAYHDLKPMQGPDGDVIPHPYEPSSRFVCCFVPHVIDVEARRASSQEIVQSEVGALFQGNFDALPSVGEVVYECSWVPCSGSNMSSKMVLRPTHPRFLLSVPVTVLKGRCVRLV